VLPAVATQDFGVDQVAQARGREMSHGAAASKPPVGILNSSARFWQILAAALIVGLLSIIFGWLTWRKFRSAGNDRGSVALKRPRKSHAHSTGMAALKHVREPEELQGFLQSYAHEHWGTARNTSLEKIFAGREVPGTGSERGDVAVIVEGISAALYAGRPADIEDLKRRCQRVIRASKKRTSRCSRQEKLTDLNPD
jgi:hypothetical protein